MPRRLPTRRHGARPVPAIIGPVQAAEPRVMLSGNVTAELDTTGVLSIVGDDEGNDLTVNISAEGTVSFGSNGGTTVNGADPDTVTLTRDAGVASVSVRMLDGDDRLRINGVGSGRHVIGDVFIRGNGGNDQISIVGIEAGGEVRVLDTTRPTEAPSEYRDPDTDELLDAPPADSPFGRDAIFLNNVTADTVTVSGGGGEDTIGLDAVTAEGSSVAPTGAQFGVRVYGGRDDDLITTQGVDSGDALTAVYGELQSDRIFSDADPTASVVRTYNQIDDEGRSDADPNEGEDAMLIVGDSPTAEQQANYRRALGFSQVRAAGVDESGQRTPGQSDDAPSLDEALDGSEFADGFPGFDPTEFTASDTGLLYRILDEGGERKPTGNDVVQADYQLFYADGQAVPGNDTYSSGNPFTTRDSNGDGELDLIDGFREGIELIGEGGRIQMIVPPELGYGAFGSGDAIPGNATLFFNVEVLSIADA